MNQQTTDVINQDIKHEQQRERAQNMGMPLGELREVDELMKRAEQAQGEERQAHLLLNAQFGEQVTW